MTEFLEPLPDRYLDFSMIQKNRKFLHYFLKLGGASKALN